MQATPTNLLTAFASTAMSGSSSASATRPVLNMPSASKFSPTRKVDTSDDLAPILAKLLNAELGEDVDDLEKELKEYLKHFRMKTDSHFTKCLNSSGSLPAATSIANAATNLPLLSSIPVANTLSEIARLVGVAQQNLLFLTDEVSLLDLQEIEISSFQANGRPGPCTGNTTAKARTSLKDLPTFKLREFSGRDDDGPEWAVHTESMFRQYGMQDYLDNQQHCQANPAFSDALAERLRAALRNGDQSATAEKLKTEKICSVVWEKICNEFDSAILKEAKQLRHWMDLFALQVKDISDFETYLNKLKEAIIYLKDLNSSAISDNVLMRAVITRGVDVPELTKCMIDIVKDQSLDADAIIASLKTEYQAIEKIDSSASTGVGKRTSRRAGTGSTKKTQASTQHSPASYLPKHMPSNTSDVFPTFLAKQLFAFWSLATNPNRTADEDKRLKDFKFRPVDKSKTGPNGRNGGRNGGDPKLKKARRAGAEPADEAPAPAPAPTPPPEVPPPSYYPPPYQGGWHGNWDGGYNQGPPGPPAHHDYRHSRRGHVHWDLPPSGPAGPPPQRAMFGGYHNARNSSQNQERGGANRGSH